MAGDTRKPNKQVARGKDWRREWNLPHASTPEQALTRIGPGGHGDVAVSPSVHVAVFRADYTDVNARLQAQAIGSGGPVNDLTVEEGAKADATNRQALDRI